MFNIVICFFCIDHSLSDGINLKILRTTKSGKFTPGSRIPIKAYKGISDDVDYAFLGAWNFKDEIFKKEKKFIKRGGKFITHVPFPKII